MGGGFGPNIAYIAGLRVAQEVDSLEPLKIGGLILIQPIFGGDQRTEPEPEPEPRLANDLMFPPCVSDVMWESSLPVGVDRDHEYCNPTVGGGFKLLEKIKVLGWKIMVTGSDGDRLFDRHMEFVKLLETLQKI